MKLTVFSFLVFAAWGLAGCGATPTAPTMEQIGKATGPSGEPRHQIACSGANWADCYEKAGAACGARGYVVVAHESSASAGASAQRAMVIECKDWSPR
jgi:hypothetical protein